jgi:hypothetical protein
MELDEGTTPLLERNDKFACVSLRYWDADWGDPQAPIDAIELAPNLWALNRLPFELDDVTRDRIGRDAASYVERPNLVIFSKHPQATPDQDLELTALDRRVMRVYVALRLVTPGISLSSARLTDGVQLENHLRIYKAGLPYGLTYQAPGTPRTWAVAPQHLHHALRVARGLLATHSTGEFHRMGRVAAAIREALGARELSTRLQQSVRALEGLILPQTVGGTAGIFSDRVKFFCGAEHVELLRQLYVMRGKVEHLHGPVAAVRAVRNDLTDESDAMIHFAFAAFVAENLARACVVRVYETPKLWPYFSTDDGVERFWKAPKAANAWGDQIDLSRIIKLFERDTAGRQLEQSKREGTVDDRADVLDLQWSESRQ